MTASLLSIEGVCKRFGGVAAVNDTGFAVMEGSITALIGPNGAGKTTMFNLVSGFLRPDRGAISFAGRSIERQRADLVARAGLVRTFQSPRVLTRMSVLDNVMLAAKNQPGERLWMSWLAPRTVARRELEVRARAREVLALVRLGHMADAYAGTLSGGQRKLLDLGRALMVEPRMILLDEPMAGVAPPLVRELVEHIETLRTRLGVTVCVIEHDMDVVMTISDRVIVMDEGRVIAEGTPDEIQQNERVIEAYLGRFARPAEVAQ
jgi:ABC-type branched-subunit amino acid transport system ATPase component